jgi:DNA recombination protein RmuC
MNAFEIMLLVGLVAVLITLIALVARLRRAAPAELTWLRESVAQQAESLAQIRERMAAAGEVGGAMTTGLSEARALLERMNAQNEASRDAQDRAQKMLGRVEAVLIGSYTKGRAGENIVGEALSCFPPDMIQTDVAIGGKRVEFALVMCDGRMLPIDSKWPSTDLLQRLAEETDPDRRAALCGEVEDQVSRRAREVAAYIDSERTLPWAVAAVPDAVFSACRKAPAEAHARGVIVLPYGMLIPYLLTLYHLHLRYASRADAGQTQARLVELARLLDNMERTLEGKLYRASTMLANACAESGQLVAAMRACVTGALAASAQPATGDNAADGAPPTTSG